jgi:hypothetical protein
MSGRMFVTPPSQPLGAVYFTDKLYSGIQLMMVGSAAGLIAVASSLKDISDRPELLSLAKQSVLFFSGGLLSGGIALCLLRD